MLRFCPVIGVKQRMEYEEITAHPPNSKAQTVHIPQSSRRRKGAVVITYCVHHKLIQSNRTGVSTFGARRPPSRSCIHGMRSSSLCPVPKLTNNQTLEGHMSPITALDFSEPYGTLVTAAQNDSQPRVWDLFSGEEIGRLRGHTGAVRCLQVEDHVCLTGAADGNVKLWDLRRVEEGEDVWDEIGSLGGVTEEESSRGDASEDGELVDVGSPGEKASVSERDISGPCARTLEGHSRAVTALYFEDECLVGGCFSSTRWIER